MNHVEGSSDCLLTSFPRSGRPPQADGKCAWVIGSGWIVDARSFGHVLRDMGLRAFELSRGHGWFHDRDARDYLTWNAGVSLFCRPLSYRGLILSFGEQQSEQVAERL